MCSGAPGKPSRYEFDFETGKGQTITERTTVQGSTGVLSILQGYFVNDYPEHQDDPPQSVTRDVDNHLEEAQRKEHEVDPTPNPKTRTTQYQSWTNRGDIQPSPIRLDFPGILETSCSNRTENQDFDISLEEA